MSNVVELVPNNALAVSPKLLADRLREFADRVERGDFEGIERAIVLTESAVGITHHHYGVPTTAMELVGMLEYVKVDIIMPSEPEQS